MSHNYEPALCPTGFTECGGENDLGNKHADPVGSLIAVAAIFLTALSQGMPDDEVRALTFCSLVVTIVALIFVNRSFSASLMTALRRPNTALRWCLIAISVLLSVTILWPQASALFRFAPLSVTGLMLALAVGVAVLVLLEAIKHVWRERPEVRRAK